MCEIYEVCHLKFLPLLVNSSTERKKCTSSPSMRHTQKKMLMKSLHDVHVIVDVTVVVGVFVEIKKNCHDEFKEFVKESHHKLGTDSNKENKIMRHGKRHNTQTQGEDESVI